MLSVFKRWCKGAGQQAVAGNVTMRDGEHVGYCPECGKVRTVDIFDEAKMLPHRK